MSGNRPGMGALARFLIPTQKDVSRLDNLRLREVPGAFLNLTQYTVSQSMAAILSYGPRFLFPPHLSAIDFFDDFGQMSNRSVSQYGIYDPTQLFLELFNRHREELAVLFRSQKLSMVEVAILDACNETHNFFTTYPDVKIVQSDKGRRTCLMTKDDYTTKMWGYVSKCIDSGVYVPATSEDVLKAREMYVVLRDDISHFLAGKEYTIPISATVLSNVMRTVAAEATLPHLYGVVKCHKEGKPIRPICSTCKWVSRPMQKLLLEVLKSGFSRHFCHENVERVDDVVNEILRMRLQRGYVFVKMDVNNMYGNMDKDKIGKQLEKLLVHPEVAKCMSLPVSLILRIFEYSMDTSCLVTFDGVTYKQVRGLPQGACDSGFLATLFLDTLLQIHKEELFVAHHVRKWFKYMDDILLYMPLRYVKNFQRTFEIITDLQLEVEYEEDMTNHPLSSYGVATSISFLDLQINRMQPSTLVENGVRRIVDGKIFTSRYTKPTSSLRMIHALSSTIYTYKVNTIKQFLNKVFSRTSTCLLSSDLLYFYNQALQNGYPPSMLDPLFHEALLAEIDKIHRRAQHMYLKPDQLDERIFALRNMLANYSDWDRDIVQETRRQHVSLARDSRNVFPYRCVEFSRLLKLGCGYGNLSLPVYSRADQSGAFSQYFASKFVSKMVDTVSNDRRRFHVGFTTCTTCGLVFILSGKPALEDLYDSEMQRKASALFMHQSTFNHIISPVVRPLRMVKGVDAAYINTIYSALFSSVGVSCSDPVVLSQVPVFIRGLLGFMQGYGIDEPLPSAVLTSPEVSMFAQDVDEDVEDLSISAQV